MSKSFNEKPKVIQIFDYIDLSVKEISAEYVNDLLMMTEKKNILEDELLEMIEGLPHNQINNAVGEYGHTLLHKAAINNFPKIIKYLLTNFNNIDINKNSQPGMTPLMLASFFGYFECIDILLNHQDIDINSVCKRGYTALQMLLLYDPEISESNKEKQFEFVKKFLSFPDIDIYRLNYRGESVISMANDRKIADIAKLLHQYIDNK